MWVRASRRQRRLWHRLMGRAPWHPAVVLTACYPSVVLRRERTETRTTAPPARDCCVTCTRRTGES